MQRKRLRQPKQRLLLPALHRRAVRQRVLRVALVEREGPEEPEGRSRISWAVLWTVSDGSRSAWKCGWVFAGRVRWKFLTD